MKKTLSELLRYGLIGFASNLAGYLSFLVITYYGVEPKLAMSLLYLSVATASFFGNRHLTFSHTGGLLGSSARYILAHILGYSINLVILITFVDELGYPYALIQGLAIFVVTGFLFITFKFFVFPKTDPLDSGKK